MSWIPDFELGVWNAWIFMLWLLVLSFLPYFVIKEKKVSERLTASPSMRFEKLLNITGTTLLIVSFIYSLFLPLQLNTVWFYIGVSIFLIGFVFLLTVLYVWRNAKPDQPFTTGPYRYSRHPAYFSFLLIYVSISLMSASWLFLIFTIIFAIMYRMFMPSEERYCLQTFGKEYQEYMERTPRWIGAPKSKK